MEMTELMKKKIDAGREYRDMQLEARSESLHDQVRKHQAESGKNLSEYMTSLITKFYEQEENTTMSNKRTIAFTVPEDIFLDFKEYLDRNNLKQGLFLLNYIKRVLAEDADAKSE